MKLSHVLSLANCLVLSRRILGTWEVGSKWDCSRVSSLCCYCCCCYQMEIYTPCGWDRGRNTNIPTRRSDSLEKMLVYRINFERTFWKQLNVLLQSHYSDADKSTRRKWFFYLLTIHTMIYRFFLNRMNFLCHSIQSTCLADICT